MKSDWRSKGFKSYQLGVATKVAKKAAAREKKLSRYLESDDRVERPRPARQVKLAFSQTPHLGNSVITLEGVSCGYPPAAPLLAALNLSVAAGQRIAITGPNGSGKTTLLRTLAGELPPLAGRVHLGPSVRLGYMAQDQSLLDPNRTPLEMLLPDFTSETKARAFLASFFFDRDEVRPSCCPAELRGQCARLVLARLSPTSATCCCWMSRSTTSIFPAAPSLSRRSTSSAAPCWQ